MMATKALLGLSCCVHAAQRASGGYDRRATAPSDIELASLRGSGLTCWVEPATVKVPFGAHGPSTFSSDHIDMAAQKGEYERAQIVVKAKDGRAVQNMTVGTSDWTFHGQRGRASSAGDSTVRSDLTGHLAVAGFQQGYIWLNKNFTATSHVRKNVSLGPGWFPDPLLPIPSGGLEVPAGWVQSLMLVVNVSSLACPGVYTAVATVDATLKPADGRRHMCTIDLKLEVWNMTLARPGQAGTLGTQFNLEMQGAFGSGKSTQSQWFDFLQQHRLSPTLFPTSYAPSIDSIELMVEAGSPQIVVYDVSELVPLPKGSPAGLPASGNYTQSQIDAALTPLALVYGNLTERNLLHRARFVVYGFDEKMTWAPQLPDISIGMRQLFGAVKARFPEFLTMTAGFGWRDPGRFPPLDMPLDIYVQLYTDSAFSATHLSCWPGCYFCPPHAPDACCAPPKATPTSVIAEFNEAQRVWASNHSYWWYFSIDPGGTGLNVYVQMEAIRARLLFWLGAAHDVSGWLYWCDDCWEPNVQTVQRINGTMLTSVGTDTVGYGDGSIVYPGVGSDFGPISSIRLENLADGIEDRELLHRLPLDERIELISQLWYNTPISPDDWRNDPTRLERLRREAAHKLLAKQEA